MSRPTPSEALEAILDEIDSADMWTTRAADEVAHGRMDAAAALAQLATAHATIAQALAITELQRRSRAAD